jgi:transcriptional regulator with XRE-family HTH domain
MNKLEKISTSKVQRLNLYYLRKKMGLTTKEVAEACNMNVGYYGKIENGRATPSQELMYRIAAALHVNKNIDKLFELTIVESNLDERELEFLNKLKAKPGGVTLKDKEILCDYLGLYNWRDNNR